MKDELNTNYLVAKRGFRSWLFTVDHKRIGLMYLIAISSSFLLGGIFALLIRLELFSRGSTLMSGPMYNKIFTLHGAVMVFLFIIPSIPGSLGNFLLPIQVGAKDVAFPKLNLLSIWIYVFGAIFAVVSIIAGSVDTGWTFYTPYSLQDPAASVAVISILTGAFILGFSSILTGLNFIVTVHKLRAPGLTWRRLPLFVWALYATSVIQILATPVLAITLVLLIFERVFGLGIFDPRLGGDPLLFQHFFWFYSHPAVYIMIVPAMGVISEVIATFSRRAIFGYFAIAMSSLALALLGFLVWAHHMFTAGISEFATMLFSALTFLVAIPSGVKIFNWLATLYKGSIRLTTPMLYALSFISLFAIGGLTGLFLGTLAVDVHLHDTYFVVAHFHYTMVGGTVIALLAGVMYWWPKMIGKLYSELLTKIGFAFVFVGFNITFLSQFVLGARGMPRRYYDYLPRFEGLHRVSTVGSWVLGLGLLITLYALLQSLWKGKKAPPNPWGSAALEWQTASPPIVQNFPVTPTITRGPYDYHLASKEEVFDGFPEALRPSSTPSEG
ncbi:cytochrome c oxidase subunit I [Pajaroellobacter abortibovis]|uniref:Cytochrome c oxidase subunit 1 n=1 Tax=Pajaroellobacter abortibovis TaxID=1882918 RepID=A0A1L6MVB9_9BACT|nr:cytochrome c oxidase subunit I [Pajaroellobacter abortibovis]APR99446.1 cytochrome c oxidase subunit I [Pajaroellobacter abortibovis]